MHKAHTDNVNNNIYDDLKELNNIKQVSDSMAFFSSDKQILETSDNM